MSGPVGWCPVWELCSAFYRGVFTWLLVCERYESLEPVFSVVAMLALAWILARRPDGPIWQVGRGAARGWNPEEWVADRLHLSPGNLASGCNGDLESNRGVVGVCPQLPLWHGNLGKLGSRLTSWHWFPAVHEYWRYWRRFPTSSRWKSGFSGGNLVCNLEVLCRNRDGHRRATTGFVPHSTQS